MCVWWGCMFASYHEKNITKIASRRLIIATSLHFPHTQQTERHLLSSPPLHSTPHPTHVRIYAIYWQRRCVICCCAAKRNLRITIYLLCFCCCFFIRGLGMICRRLADAPVSMFVCILFQFVTSSMYEYILWIGWVSHLLPLYIHWIYAFHASLLVYTLECIYCFCV